MSTVENVRVTATWFASSAVTLRVDRAVLTAELATEINDFWSGNADRLSTERGDVVRAVTRLFGAAAIRYFMQIGGAHFRDESKGRRLPEGVIKAQVPEPGALHDVTEFRNVTEEVIKAQAEGWPGVDKLGILIVEAQVFAVGFGDVEITREGAA